MGALKLGQRYVHILRLRLFWYLHLPRYLHISFFVHSVTGTYLFLAVLPWDLHMPFRVLTRRHYPPCLEHSMCMTSPERTHVPRNLPGQPQSCAPTSCLCTYFDRVSTLLIFFQKFIVDVTRGKPLKPF